MKEKEQNNKDPLLESAAHALLSYATPIFSDLTFLHVIRAFLPSTNDILNTSKYEKQISRKYSVTFFYNYYNSFVAMQWKEM
jgi:hypothetical protein